MEEPRPYQFGRAATQSPALLACVDRTGDRLARRLRGILEPLSGVRPGVVARPAEQTTMMLWDACVPAFTALSLYRLHPVKGTVVLRIDAALVSSLVDRFYGGTGGAIDAHAREFTPTETRILDRLSGQIMAALCQGWADVVPVDAVLTGHETAVSQADIAPREAELVVQRFDVNLGEKTSRAIEIIYPLDGLACLEMGNASRCNEDQRAFDPVWAAQLGERMEDVRLPARTVLARPNLKMTELLALKPGDVINIHIARHLPLIVGDRVFAHGTIGEQDGRAAFMIDKLA